MDIYNMNLFDQWSLLLGIIGPFVVATINRREWSRGVRSGVVFAYVLVATLIGEIIKGTVFNQAPTWRTVLSSIIIIFLLTESTYKTIWEPNGLAPRWEAKSSKIIDKALGKNVSENEFVIDGEVAESEPKRAYENEVIASSKVDAYPDQEAIDFDDVSDVPPPPPVPQDTDNDKA